MLNALRSDTNSRKRAARAVKNPGSQTDRVGRRGVNKAKNLGWI